MQQGLLEIVKRYRAIKEFSKFQPVTRSKEIFTQEMLNYYQGISRAKEAGKPLAMVGLFVPIEIFHALDIIPFVVEYFTMMLVSETDCSEYLDAAAGYGMPADICSLHRLLVGLSVKEAIPAPDFIVSTSQTCDTTIKSYECLGNFYQCPAFYLDFPYWDADEALKYYENEIEELIAFLERQTNRKLNLDRLKKVLELSKQEDELFFEISELKKSVPSPMGLRDAVRHFGIHLILPGTEEGVAYFRAVRDECKEMVAAKKGAAAKENYRILWLYVPILYGRLYEWMKRKYGAVVVMDTISYTPPERMDISNPLRCLARKAYNQFITAQYCQPIEKFIKDVVKLVEDYKVDACIYQAHIGCKHGCGSIRMLKDAVQSQCGIPFFILDGDAMDPTVASTWEMKNNLEGFFEMLEDL